MTPSPVPPPSKQPRRSGHIRKAVNKDIVSADKNAPSQQRNVVNQLPTQKPSKQQAKIANKSGAPSTTTTTATTTIATAMSDLDTAPAPLTTDQLKTQQPPKKKPKRTTNDLQKGAKTATLSLPEA